MSELLKSKGNKPRRGIVKICWCGKEFYLNPSRTKSIYCSVSCRNRDVKQRVYLRCPICSKDYFRYISQIKHRGESKGCSVKCRGILQRGKSSPHWILDRKELKTRPNGNQDHKEWRNKVFKRDNFICQDCGIRNGNGVEVYLEAHHIKRWADYPESRFELSNGLTLCRECHNKTKGRRRSDSDAPGTRLSSNARAQA